MGDFGQDDMPPMRTYAYTGGFFTQRRIRRIMELSGHPIRFGLPNSNDCVAVWGNSPRAHRGITVAQKRQASLIYVEDAFIRSLFPARQSATPPKGLLIDRSANHFDASKISDLERILTQDPLDHGGDLQRARDAMARMRSSKISKYSAHGTDMPDTRGGYVLVIDQTRDDAAVLASKGDDALFSEMLYYAQENHPNQRIIIKTHPETRAVKRAGYFTAAHCTTDKISLYSGDASIWDLMENAIAVYTVSSTVGFEAIIAGHRPHVFGNPFYAGWGLTHDAFPVQRRQRRLTAAQLFLGAMIRYPKWYDVYTDQLCEIETILDQTEAELRAYNEDRLGWNAQHIRLWKRHHFRTFFGAYGPVRFRTTSPTQPTMIWANRATSQTQSTRVEDGFIRSRGLGADLIPPLSLVTDKSGIYYDPTAPSDLENLISQGPALRLDQQVRIERLIARIISSQISKYNLSGTPIDLPDGHKILVPGQVEDDASILKGCDDIRTNLGLLKRVRADNPNSIIIYKPHPDVVAGLRLGAIDDDIITQYADITASTANISDLLSKVDAVHKMTSLTGFEALLRKIPVTTYGTPFYAGWGLTTDHGAQSTRRGLHRDLNTFAHRALIDYPRYFDPITKTACPIEVALQRVEDNRLPPPGPLNRLLAKLQGVFASATPFWR
jgi:capsular polysaccharide export protein